MLAKATRDLVALVFESFYKAQAPHGVALPRDVNGS